MKDFDEYMRDLAINDPEKFKWQIAMMIGYYKNGSAQPDTEGSCSSKNCSGTTGCSQLTPDGFCACQGPNGPCHWVALPPG